MASSFLKIKVLLGCLCLCHAKLACHICGTRGNSALAFPTETCIEFEGRNCLKVAMDVAKQDLTSIQCGEEQRKYAACCNNIMDLQCVKKSNIVVSPDITGGVKVTYVGPYPVCSICKSGQLPTKNNQVINMLYIGPGTCKTYWVHGQAGKIPRHLCDPVQFFLLDICGC